MSSYVPDISIARFENAAEFNSHAPEDYPHQDQKASKKISIFSTSTYNPYIYIGVYIYIEREVWERNGSREINGRRRGGDGEAAAAGAGSSAAGEAAGE